MQLLIRSSESAVPSYRSDEQEQGVEKLTLLGYHLQHTNMTSQVSAELKAEYKQTFDMFDTDQSGRISSAELGQVMEQLGQNPTEADLHAMVSEVDADGDGEINFEEFLMMMAKKENSDNDEIRAAFEIFDKNQDGFISPTELRTVMESLGEVLTEADIETMMKGADQNGDGQVSFDEFAVMMRGKWNYSFFMYSINHFKPI